MERKPHTLWTMLEARSPERTAGQDRIWRHSLDLLVVLSFDGTIRACNPAWEATLGYHEDEVVGQHFTRFLHADDHGTAFTILGYLIIRSVRQVENRYRHRDGSWRWISWTAVADGGQIYGVGRDITTEKTQDQALAAAAEALRQAQKLEAVGQLTAGIAHDFNNMLQSVTSGIALARRRMKSGRMDDAWHFLDAAVEAADRAAGLTQRLLAFGRRQTLNPKPITVDALMLDLRALIDSTVGPAIQVDLQLKDGDWPVICDVVQLESALLNLVTNSRDAMALKPGVLRLVTSHETLNEAATRDWQDAPPGDYVCIMVSDNGTGMSHDVLAHAFEPFFTTKPNGQGTGLGLSQVYGFVRQSNGIVRLESVVGAGTCVRLYLPRFKETLGNGRAAASVGSGHQRAEGAKTVPTVLLVEDEASIRRFTAEALREVGCRVVDAADGPAGLRALQASLRDSQLPSVDLLVTDVGLPGGLNGRQLADAARALVADLPVLLITGYAGDAFNGMGQLAAGMDVLVKPFDLAVLIKRVQAMTVHEQAPEEIPPKATTTC